ncbi:hypothetical protein [Leptolyngbya phage Lbo-JY46]
MRDGYVLISPITGSKCFINGFENFKKQQNNFDEDYWNLYKAEKKSNSTRFAEMQSQVRKYFNFKGIIERMALNYPIQGQSAEITKIACIMFFDWIVQNKYLNIVKIVNTVHDEIVAECPDDLVNVTSHALEAAMNNAAKIYCKRVLLTASPEASKFWKK